MWKDSKVIKDWKYRSFLSGKEMEHGADAMKTEP
jgi:hypothetical protein